MNPIVKKISTWFTETSIACVLEIFLEVLINVWNHFIVEYNFSLPQIDIEKLHSTSNCRDAATSYELSDISDIQIADDLIVLDTAESKHAKNLKSPNTVATETQVGDPFDIIEDAIKDREKQSKTLKPYKVTDQEILINNKVAEDENIIQKFRIFVEQSRRGSKNYEILQVASRKVQDHFPNVHFQNISSNCRNDINTEGLDSKHEVQYSSCVRNSFVASDYEVRHPEVGNISKEKRKKEILKTQHADDVLTEGTANKTEKNERESCKKRNSLSVDGNQKGGFENSNQIAEDIPKNGLNKEFSNVSSFESAVDLTLQEIPINAPKDVGKVMIKHCAIINQGREPQTSNESNANKRKNPRMKCETNSQIQHGESSSDCRKEIIRNILSAELQNRDSRNVTYEVEDTSLKQSSLIKEKTYSEHTGNSGTTRAKQKYRDSAHNDYENKYGNHGGIYKNLHGVPRDTVGLKFDKLSHFDQTSENNRTVKRFYLEHEQFPMVISNGESKSEQIEQINSSLNESQEERGAFKYHSSSEKQSCSELVCGVPEQSPCLDIYTGDTRRQENLKQSNFRILALPVSYSEDCRQTDSKTLPRDIEGTSSKTQTKPITEAKKVQFKSEVEKFVYEPNLSIMENFRSFDELALESSVLRIIDGRRSETVLQNHARRPSFDDMPSLTNFPDEYTEEWVDYDQRVMNIVRDHPRIPEMALDNIVEDITDIPEKQIKSWPRLKEKRRILGKKVDPYCPMQEELPGHSRCATDIWSRIKEDHAIFRKKKDPYPVPEDTSGLSRRFQGLKLDPKLLINKLKKKVLRK